MPGRQGTRFRGIKVSIAVSIAILLASAGAGQASNAKALAPIPAATVALMAAKGTDAAAPILVRTFKKESELEIWKKARNGRYVLLKTMPICRWSGQLGPKTKQGDRQTPEGFYAVPPQKMNPNSSYYLSFDVGYPNAFDRAHGRTGSYLMVHGTCSSMGCFAMTDAQISELYALAREAFAGGQKAFQFHAFPFRMTARNMARARKDEHIEFWRQLKEGYDRFEATGEEPSVGVSGGRYVFAPSRDKAQEERAQALLAEERERTAQLIEDGSAAVRYSYADGGMHAVFASLSRSGNDAGLGPVSRPDALALAGREQILIPARKKPPITIVALSPYRAPPLGPVPAAAALAVMFVPAPLGPARLATAAPPMAGSSHILPAAWAGRPPERVAMRGN